MSRFVDRNKVKVVSLGPCRCPDAPHGEDTVRIREQLSYADQIHLADAANTGMTEALWTLFNLRVAGWTFTDDKGKPVVLSRANWQNLDEETAGAIQDAISEIKSEADELPNASSAPSVDT